MILRINNYRRKINDKYLSNNLKLQIESLRIKAILESSGLNIAFQVAFRKKFDRRKINDENLSKNQKVSNRILTYPGNP